MTNPIAAAYWALTPTPSNPPTMTEVEANVKVLNAQTTTSTTPLASVPVAAVHGVLLLSATYDWAKIETQAAQAYSTGWPSNPNAGDGLIAAAKNAVTLATSQVTAVQPADWPAFLASLQALQSAGVVSTESLAAVEALATYTQPVWSPPLTVGDLQTALGVI